ncbi:MAG: protein translocase subunit SecD [Candidatus Omnitrophica bacterium]|nr:protein translocase subunit SecD [Candidatus Omnitrophota bacterium]
MSKSLRNRVLLILAVIAGALYCTFPLDKRINLGLDLKGGMHLILKVETEKLDENAKLDAVPRAIEILRNRIDGLGVSEPVIQRQGEDQIIVQLPGVTDRDASLRMIGRVAQLEFMIVEKDTALLQKALQGEVLEGYILKYTKDDQEPVLLQSPAAMKGDAISNAKVDFDTAGFGQALIALEFNSQGADQFGDLTRKHVGDRLAIVLDGEVLSAPNIREPILSGRGEITGNFTYEEASMLSLALRSGSLPAPMRVEEERTIGPLLGKDSIESGIRASIIGFLAVIIFMAIYYLWAGLIADVALLLNLVLITGAMGFLKVTMPDSQVTLTLPGIAGVILTLGMAVDANVLINERIREELNNGRPLRAAVNSGFTRAFSAILDSNVTTLIAAFMLFQFGSGPIKGFAVTLSIGLLASLFTAVFVTRTIFMVLLELNLLKSLPMLRFFTQTKIDFISKRYIFFTISLLIIVIAMAGFFQKGQKAFGIDFVGGQIQEYRFEKPVAADQLREYFKQKNIPEAVILTYADHPEDITVRTAEDTYDHVVATFKEKMPDNHFEVLRIEKVGPIVGKALRTKAILAMTFALLAILVYVGFRFKHFDFAAAGVIALLHDVLMTLGVAVALGRQVDLLVVTALLTIAGYSINDTIVIYDRVRENMAASGKRMSLKEILNLSINQTLSRTILTSSVTFLVVLALFFMGGEVLNTFALCLMIGFLSGVYSTVFIAFPLVLLWTKQPQAR